MDTHRCSQILLVIVGGIVGGGGGTRGECDRYLIILTPHELEIARIRKAGGGLERGREEEEEEQR